MKHTATTVSTLNLVGHCLEGYVQGKVFAPFPPQNSQVFRPGTTTVMPPFATDMLHSVLDESNYRLDMYRVPRRGQAESLSS